MHHNFYLKQEANYSSLIYKLIKYYFSSAFSAVAKCLHKFTLSNLKILVQLEFV